MTIIDKDKEAFFFEIIELCREFIPGYEFQRKYMEVDQIQEYEFKLKEEFLKRQISHFFYLRNECKNSMITQINYCTRFEYKKIISCLINGTISPTQFKDFFLGRMDLNYRTYYELESKIVLFLAEAEANDFMLLINKISNYCKLDHDKTNADEFTNMILKISKKLTKFY